MKRLILILSAICLGCQNASDYSQAGRNLEITFAEIEEISSKSGETAQEVKSEIPEEQKINTVDLFIFNTAGKLENRTRFSSDIYQPKTVSVTTAGEKSIYAIANADGNINLNNLPNNDAITTSDIESLEIFHKNIHTSLPYVSKTKQILDLLTTPKVELKFQRIHAKIEIINQTPEQLTVSAIETSGLPTKAYLFKPETPQSTEYNQKTIETTFYTFATQTPIKVELTSEVDAAAKKIIKEFPKVLSSETNIINIAKVDNSEIKILSNDDWQGYQSTGIHQLGDISVVSEGASFSEDGALLTYSNTQEYTITLTAPNYTLSDLTLKSNQPWLTITQTTNPYKITIQKNDKEEERTAVLSINKNETAIKYIVVKQAKKPIIYYIQEPIIDNIKQKLAEKLEVAGGAKSGILSVESSLHEPLAPFAMDPTEGITQSNENLTTQTLTLSFASIASGSTKRTTTLKVLRVGGAELSSLTINQTPHVLTVPDFNPFIATYPLSQTQAVTASGATPGKDWTISTPPIWLTATKSANNLTLQASNNAGAERTTKLTLNYDGTTLEKTVTQQNGYSFNLTTPDATIENDNLKAYSIAKTYTLTITPLEAIDFSTVKATLTGQPFSTWEITQPKGENATGTSTKGTFTIKLPAATLTTEPEATIKLKIGALEVKTLKVTQAKNVSFSTSATSTPLAYNIIGGESASPVITYDCSTWDITKQSTATGATLSVTTDATNKRFTINAASSLEYNTATTNNTITLKSDKDDVISTYSVSQKPVTFTIANKAPTATYLAGSQTISITSNSSDKKWTIKSITPTSSWLTATNDNNANTALKLAVQKNTTTSTRSATIKLESKGTTSEIITLTQDAGYGITLSTTAATITSKDSTLLAYSIDKTYNITITSTKAINYSNITLQCTNSSWTANKLTTGTTSSGSFSIRVPKTTSANTQSGTVTILLDNVEIKSLPVVQARKIEYGIDSPYSVISTLPYALIGGEDEKSIRVTYSDWDIRTKTATNVAGLTISAGTAIPTPPTLNVGKQATTTFKVTPSSTLKYDATQKRSSLSLKNDKSEEISKFDVTQDPVKFTFGTNPNFADMLAAGESRTMTVTTAPDITPLVSKWTVNVPNGTTWITSATNVNDLNKNLKVTVSKNSSSARSTTITITCKGTTSQEVSVSQKAGYTPKPNEVVIGTQTWLNFNVGTSPKTLVTTLPSANWESSKGGLYNWTTAMTACPTGYRLPTKPNYETLLSNTDKAYPKNGTKLYLKLTDKVSPFNTLEFPAAGYRDSGTLSDEGMHGYYWSSTEYSSTVAYLLDIKDGGAGMKFYTKLFELSVRCLQ